MQEKTAVSRQHKLETWICQCRYVAGPAEPSSKARQGCHWCAEFMACLPSI